MSKKKINEASGYIPKNQKEANDPRWQMAITNDIKPGESQRQAARLGFKVDAEGRPPLLKSNGKINEAMMDVGVQARQPISPGSRGLMNSRSEFEKYIAKSNETINRSAADALAWAVKEPRDVHKTIFEIADKFKIHPDALSHIFKQQFGVTFEEFAKIQLKKRQQEPKRI